MNSHGFIRSRLSEKRSLYRAVPPRPLSASLDDFRSPAFGTVSNISNFGACIAADHLMPIARPVRITIAFPSQPTLFEAGGQVTWNGVARGTGHANVLHGVRFVYLTDDQRETLRQVLGSKDFQSPLPATEPVYQDLLGFLQPTLEQLGKTLESTDTD